MSFFFYFVEKGMLKLKLIDMIIKKVGIYIASVVMIP